MYIPILKNRASEMRVLSQSNNLIGKNMIPLIELISSEYQTRYERDPITDEFIYVQGPKKRKRVKIEPTEVDNITFEKIKKYTANNKCFVEPFRYDSNDYPRTDINKVLYAFEISRDYEKYKNQLIKVSQESSMIPVISIKKSFETSKDDLGKLVNILKGNSASIGLRITIDLFDDYVDSIKDMLDKNDFIFIDLQKNNLDSKELEIEDIKDNDLKCNKILLNCPRRNDINNVDYEENKVTVYIKNCVAERYQDYDFDGFGDYGGLKDTLPSDRQGGGTGAALALIYNKKTNVFISFVNKNTSLGIKGYNEVRKNILSNQTLIEEFDTCEVIKKIKDMNRTFGNWNTWIEYCLKRYIVQVTK